ncbi:Hypothetical protein, putative, partial [Bodo saltans]
KNANEFLQSTASVLAQHPAVTALFDVVRRTNATALIVPAVNSVVPMSHIIKTGYFTPQFAQSMNKWMDDIKSGVQHNPETLEYGVGSFFYTAQRPFHPGRAYEWLEQYFSVKQMVPDADDEEAAMAELESNTDSDSLSSDEEDGENEGEESSSDEEAASDNGSDMGSSGADEATEQEAKNSERLKAYGNLFRGKGFLWLGNPKRVDSFAQISLAGNVLNFTYGGPWADFPDDTAQRKPAATSRSSVAPLPQGKHFHYNPKSQQLLVFIGQSLNAEALKRDLDALLLTDDECSELMAHMDDAVSKEERRVASGRARKWRDRAWLNDLFEDYFEDFPLPLSPLPSLPTIHSHDEESDEEVGASRDEPNVEPALQEAPAAAAIKVTAPAKRPRSEEPADDIW